MRVIGIDPGKTGAWCLLESDPQLTVVKLQALPTKLSGRGKTVIDAAKLSDNMTLLTYLNPFAETYTPPDLVVMEQIVARPLKGNGPASGTGLLSFGRTLGKIEAVLEILGWPVREVAPQTWKASILRDTDKSKQAAIGTVQGLFPGVNLKPTPRSKPSHDWAEAVCMAMYGLKLLQGGQS